MDGKRHAGELAGAGPAFFQLVRFWSRRWITRAALQIDPEPAADDRRVRDVLVLEAVDAAAARTPEVSVADVAHQLGIDRSGASRLIGDAISRGHLKRETSAIDARRAVIVPTKEGSKTLAEARAWQEKTFAAVTRGWEPDDAARLAEYLRRLAAELPDH